MTGCCCAMVTGWNGCRSTLTDPAKACSSSGDAAEVPGRQNTLDYVVGPGWHVVEIAAQQRPLLVQASIWRPEISLLVLPELTPASVTAAALGLAYGEPERNESDSWSWLPFGKFHIRRDEAPQETGPANAGLPVQVVTGCKLEPRTLYTLPSVSLEPAARTELLNRLAQFNPPDLAWPTSPPSRKAPGSAPSRRLAGNRNHPFCGSAKH